MKNTKLLLLTLILIVVISGCTSQKEITQLIKTLPEVSEFLDQHPNADIKAVLWTKNVVERNIEEIRKDCGEQVEVGRYWKVVVKEGNVDITVWIDDETKEPFCIIKHRTTEGKTIPQLPSEQVSGEEGGLSVPSIFPPDAFDWLNQGEQAAREFQKDFQDRMSQEGEKLVRSIKEAQEAVKDIEVYASPYNINPPVYTIPSTDEIHESIKRSIEEMNNQITNQLNEEISKKIEKAKQEMQENYIDPDEIVEHFNKNPPAVST